MIRSAPLRFCQNRINIRTGAETLEGLKRRAADAGLPCQTPAASVLHMVTTGKLKLDLVKC